VKARCTATSKRSGERCKRYPTPGATVCRFHGGKAPQVKGRALERLESTRARSLLARLGEPEPIGHPVAELLAVAAELKAWQRILRERVAELVSFSTSDVMHIERERAVVTLYERSLDRTERILVDMMKLDLAERMARITKEQGRTIAELLKRIIDDDELALDEHQRAVASTTVARHLRLLSDSEAKDA
jgi:hypothetical protein